MNHDEINAHNALTETARLRTLDSLYDRRPDDLAIRRERRNTNTDRRPVHPREVFAERQQQMIEAGIWPVYTP